MTNQHQPHSTPGRIYAARYEVDVKLASMDLTITLLARCAEQGDIDRRSVPVFGYDGHDEYAAGSRIRSTLCEYGGETDGGWHAGNRHKVPVAFNHNKTIAIHPTAGTEGTGKVEGDPYNKSLKGPYSTKAARAQTQLELDDDVPVDFWWFFTRRDEAGLWAELFNPIIEEDGYASGFVERVILGNLGTTPIGGREPLPKPSPAHDISVPRRAG